MRHFSLLLVLFAANLAAHAAPRKVAKKASVPSFKATPLSPEKLRGQVTYIQGRDVWAINPNTRQKHLLFKDLLTSANTFRTSVSEIIGNLSDVNIAWSPDRKNVVYALRKPFSDNYNLNGAELFIMRWDGSQKRQLTNTKYRLLSHLPRFSPDGAKLLYTQSSTYHGGPGNIEISIHVLDLASKKDAAIGLSTSYAPFWSRDGNRILFTYFQGSLDYLNMGPPPVRQTMKPDGTDIQPFANDWQNYLGDNQSRDGTFHLVRTQTGTNAVWEIYGFDTTAAHGVIFREEGGLKPSRFSFGDSPNSLAMQAQLLQWFVAKDGTAQIQTEDDIWMIEKKNGYFNSLRRLVKNAQLIDWL